MRLIDIEPFETEKGAESCRITRWFVGDGYSTQVVTHTRDIPTIDPASLRPKGEWISVKNPQWPAYSHDKCNICGWWNTKNALCYDGNKKPGHSLNFCPNCGADMRGNPNDS